MKLDIIAQIVQILKDAPEVGAIEIRRGLFGAWSSVRVSKAGHGGNATGGHILVTQSPTIPQSPVSAPRGMGTGESPPPAGPQLLEIKSPMVGTFYRAPAPDADNYVEENSAVTVGQTVCIVEAMKLMNEIESEVEGRIARILVENAQPVEYGQTLFLVESDTAA